MNIFKIPLLGCHNYESSRLKFPCYVQPKLNGIRAQYINGQFISRDRKFWNHQVVEHIVKELQFALPQLPKDVVLDGEFYHHGWTLGQHISAINVSRVNPTEETLKVKFNVFDIWCKLFEGLNFTSRMSILIKNQVPSLVPTLECYNIEDVDRVYKAMLTAGYEGTININKYCMYKAGKSWDKLKRKRSIDSEFKCVDMERGSGKYLKTMGKLICETSNGTKFKVGTGFTDEERNKFYGNYCLGKLITVQYQELSAKGIPLNPRYLSVRDYE